MKCEKVLLNQQPFLETRDTQLSWPIRGIWAGKWISISNKDEDKPQFSAFKHILTCESEENKFQLHVAADAEYKFFIDGKLVASGPELGSEKEAIFDSYNIELNQGKHVFIFVVASWGKAGAYNKFQFRHGLLTLCGERIELNSNSDNFEVLKLDAFATKPTLRECFSVGEELIFDSSKFPQSLLHGDSCLDWEKPRELYMAYDSGVANEYWANQLLLSRATLPPMIDDEIHGYKILYAGNYSGNYIDSINNLLPLKEQFQMLNLQDIVIKKQQHITILLNLNNYYCVLPYLKISHGKNAKISIGFTEALQVDNSAKSPKANRQEWDKRYIHAVYDHFVADGRENMEFFTFHYRAGVFGVIEIETFDEDLTIHKLTLRESRYPLDSVANFSTNLKILEHVAIKSLRTLEMCSHDTFMDCPFYEQLMYLGDTRIQSLLTLSISRDSRLVEKALKLFAKSITQTGFLQSRYPSKITQVIPTFSPFFVAMLHDYAKWHGGELCAELLPTAKRIVDAFDSKIDGNGLIDLSMSWAFVDWSSWVWGVPPNGEKGYSSIINLLYLYAIEELEQLLRLMGHHDLVIYYQNKATRVANGIIKHFFDREKGGFTDVIGGDVVSEHAQILALLSNKMPVSVENQCLETLFNGDLKYKATVYFNFYYFEICQKFNKIEQFMERLNPYFDMDKLGLFTMLEAPEPARSDCHAWSSHPLYYFLSFLLGIIPEGYGFEKVLIKPNIPSSITKISGQVAHAKGGIIAVAIDNGKITITLPPHLDGTFIDRNNRPHSLKEYNVFDL